MEFGQQYIAVMAVLGLLGGALWWVRRRGFAVAAGRRTERQLQAVDRLALSPQHTLHLVQVGTSMVLLACSPAGCEVVGELAPQAQAGSGA